MADLKTDSFRQPRRQAQQVRAETPVTQGFGRTLLTNIWRSVRRACQDYAPSSNSTSDLPSCKRRIASAMRPAPSTIQSFSLTSLSSSANGGIWSRHRRRRHGSRISCDGRSGPRRTSPCAPWDQHSRVRLEEPKARVLTLRELTSEAAVIVSLHPPWIIWE